MRLHVFEVDPCVLVKRCCVYVATGEEIAEHEPPAVSGLVGTTRLPSLAASGGLFSCSWERCSSGRPY